MEDKPKHSRSVPKPRRRRLKKQPPKFKLRTPPVLRTLPDLQPTEPVEVAELDPTQRQQHKDVVKVWAQRDKREAEIKAEKRRDRDTRQQQRPIMNAVRVQRTSGQMRAR